MKFRPRVFLVLLLVFFSFTAAAAQTSSAVDSLRSQLKDLQTKEADLQTRIKQLDEDMRPESLEKFFALNGSTRPEQLREQRRLQLESQKATLQSQLEQVGASKARVEGSIATAEAASYRQSAIQAAPSQEVVVAEPIKTEAKPKQSKRRAKRHRVVSRKRRG